MTLNKLIQLLENPQAMDSTEVYDCVAHVRDLLQKVYERRPMDLNMELPYKPIKEEPEIKLQYAYDHVFAICMTAGLLRAIGKELG